MTTSIYLRIVEVLKKLSLFRIFNGVDVVKEAAHDVGHQVYVEQFINRARLSVTAAPAGLAVVLALAWEFRVHLYEFWLPFSLAGLICIYALMIFTCWSWLRSAHPPTVQRFNRQFSLILGMLGTFWAMALVTMTAVATPSQQALLFGLAIGLISTTAGASPLSVALPFWVPVTIGAFIAVWLAGDGQADWAILICLISYSLLTLSSVLYLNTKLTERLVNVVKLERSSETIRVLLRDFQQSESDWLWEADADLVLRNISARFAEAAGQTADRLTNGFLTVLADPRFLGVRQGDPMLLDQSINTLAGHLAGRTPFRDLVVPVRVAAEQRWWALTGSPLWNAQGKFEGFRGVGSDVTEAHQSHSHITYLAHHDMLTGLANRAKFNEALAAALADPSAKDLALLYIDLDEFKAVNDTHGHTTGDALLRAVAGRIDGSIRTMDLAARLGGDEFAVLLTGNGAQDFVAVARRIVAQCKLPFRFKDTIIRIGVSIGIALAPSGGDTAEDLIRNADLALYEAKSQGRGQWRLFNDDMDRRLGLDRDLQHDFRQALERQEFFLEFQPIFDLRSRRMIGVEALARWRHPVHGIIHPAEFIGIAEQSGLISLLDMKVIAMAAAVARGLPAPISMAVNISALHLQDHGAADQMAAVIEAADVAQGRFIIEVTETTMLQTLGATPANLSRLRAIGCRIAMDDFGTSYSSLGTLRQFPFDILKIDRSFISDIGISTTAADSKDLPILKAIIELGRAIGVTIIAEGTETEAQIEILSGFGCDAAQGFFFGKAMPGQALLAELKASGMKTSV